MQELIYTRASLKYFFCFYEVVQLEVSVSYICVYIGVVCLCCPQAPSDAPLRLRAGLDVQDLTSGKGAELVFDDNQGLTGMLCTCKSVNCIYCM